MKLEKREEKNKISFKIKKIIILFDNSNFIMLIYKWSSISKIAWFREFNNKEEILLS